MSQVKAISPEEALHEKQNSIPEAVLTTVNALLAERWDGRSCVLRQAEVLTAALELMKAQGANVTKDEFYKRHWLDFEPLYKEAGWKVVYDKPGYNESYEPTWQFTKA